MKAFNVSFKLLCEECSHEMRADDVTIAPGRIFWRCENKDCVEFEKIFVQQMPQVNLTEVVQ